MKADLLQYFENRQEIPLIYFETGFELWGIPNSLRDSEIRGYHFNSPDLEFEQYPPVLEVHRGNIISSIDIVTMFRNLANCNRMNYEWLRTEELFYNMLNDWDSFRLSVIKEYNYNHLSNEFAKSAKRVYELQYRPEGAKCVNILYIIHKIMSAEISFTNIPPELLINELLNQYEGNKELVELGRLCIELFKQDQLGQLLLPEKKYKNVLDKHINRFYTVNNYSPEPSKKLTNILTDYFNKIRSRYS